MITDELMYISLRGRVAFGIGCFENMLLSLHYNVEEWKIVLEYLWQFTSIRYLDDWNGMVSEIIPSNLLEFREYAKHDFEYLDESTFRYLHNLYQNIDEKVDYIMSSIYNIGTSHAYSIIEGFGQQSLEQLELLINYMDKNNIPLPHINDFKKFAITENKGWGNKFNGKEISCILQNND